MTKEQREYLFKGMLALGAILIAFNLFFFFAKEYMTVSDNNFIADGYKRILSVKYFELFTQKDSISVQVSTYLLETAHGTDSGTYEKLGAILILAGTVLAAIGTYQCYQRKGSKLLVIGAAASAIGAVVLQAVFNAIESAVSDSILGSLGALFGAGIIFKSSVGTLMLVNLLGAGAVALLAYLYYYYGKKPDAENNNESEENGHVE